MKESIRNYLEQPVSRPERIGFNSTVSVLRDPETGVERHFAIVPGKPRHGTMLDFWEIDPSSGELIGDNGMVNTATRSDKGHFVITGATASYSYGKKFLENEKVVSPQ